MRARLFRCMLIVFMAAAGGCQAAPLLLGKTDSTSTMEGTLTPPAAGDASGASGWSLTIAGNPICRNMDVSRAQADAVALQGKLVTATIEWASPPSRTDILRSVKVARLKGTARHVPIDSRHPTGWMFSTSISGQSLEVALDPARVINAAERSAGSKIVVTGSLQGVARTGVRLVADTLEPG